MENTLENHFETPIEQAIEPIAEPTFTTSSLHNYYQPPEVHLVLASVGQRFANYAIDLVIFYIAVFGFGVFLGIIFPSLVGNISGIDSFLDRILFLFLYGIYMGLMELMTRGRSIGKYITGTKAVNYDGTSISAATAFARGLSRAVPFNQLSAFGDPPNPWHDRWNNTHVVVIKLSTLP